MVKNSTMTNYKILLQKKDENNNLLKVDKNNDS